MAPTYTRSWVTRDELGRQQDVVAADATEHDDEVERGMDHVLGGHQADAGHEDDREPEGDVQASKTSSGADHLARALVRGTFRGFCSAPAS